MKRLLKSETPQAGKIIFTKSFRQAANYINWAMTLALKLLFKLPCPLNALFNFPLKITPCTMIVFQQQSNERSIIHLFVINF